MQIAVLGSGGIGGYYGALLAKTGHDVVFIARGTHLEALQRQGLTVRTPEGSSTLPVMAVADTSGVGSVDLVLFCVKSYDTEPAALALPPLMGRETAVLTLQNGVDNVEAIASVVGSSERCCPARSMSRSSSPAAVSSFARGAKARSSSARSAGPGPNGSSKLPAHFSRAASLTRSRATSLACCGRSSFSLPASGA